MSLFASDITESLEIGDCVVTIRKLSWKKLREAAQAKADAEIGFMAKAGRDVMQTMRDAIQSRQGPAAPATVEEVVDPEISRAARYQTYDRGVVLLKGIKSISNGDGRKLEKLTEAIDDLDEVVAERCHRAILDLSLPPIDVAAQKEIEKKD